MSTKALGNLYSVFKLRIGFAIAFSALAGLAAAGTSPEVGLWQAVVLVLAVIMASASAGAFNQFVERDLDATMARTRERPFVTGTYTAGPAWIAAILAILALGVGAAAVSLGVVAALHVFLGAFVYGVVYTVWLKRRTWLNIVIGGLAGSFAVLAGAAVVDPVPGPAPILLALVLFLWTPPHFWSLAMAVRDQYSAAGVPMLPVVVGDRIAAWAILAHTVALVAVSLAMGMVGLGWVYLVAAGAGGALFVVRSIRLVRRPGPKTAIANFHASLIQLALLLTGCIVDRLVLG
jgi:protoheme IX farnesyltransferase